MKQSSAIRAVAMAFALIGSGASAFADPVQPATVSAYVAPKMAHEPYGDILIVVPLTSDDKFVQMMKLRNLANSLKAADAWHGTLTVKVVLYAKGVSLLKDPDDQTRQQLDLLRSRGIQFLVCNNTLQEQGIDFHKLYKVTDSDIVPSGFMEVAYLQAVQHYTVDPMN